MKIAMMAARLPPANDGVGDHADKLGRTLALAGNDVTMIAAGKAAPSDLYELELVGRDWGLRGTVRAIAFLCARDFDSLIIEYTPFYFGARTLAPLLLSVVATFIGIRTAVIVHEAFYPPGSLAARNPIKAALLAVRDAATISTADIIAVPSAARAEALTARLPQVRSRIVIVPIGSNIEPTSDYRHSPSDKRTIVSFGTVMPRRQLEIAIATVAELVRDEMDIRLDIIGRMEDRAYVARLQERAREQNVSERVRFRGDLTPSQISDEFRTAVAALHTAREGTPASSGSLLALLAHGVPTVALQTENDDPVFAQALHYAVHIDALAPALREVLSDSNLADKLTASGAGCYAAHFSWTSAASRLLDAIVARPLSAKLSRWWAPLTLTAIGCAVVLFTASIQWNRRR